MTTLISFFEESVERFPDHIFLWEKTNEHYQGTTYRQIRESVIRFASGLMDMGLKPGDRVALLSEGRNDWVISELAILYNGAVNVPLSIKLTESEIRFRLKHAEVCMVITSVRYLNLIRGVKRELPILNQVIVLDEPTDSEPGEILFRQLMYTERQARVDEKDPLTERWQAILPDDLANICYTSGTTADPKGIMLTHGNYVANIFQAYSLMDIDPSFRTLLILPWDHAFAHTAGIYCFMGKGASVASVQPGKTHMETLRNLPLNIREIKPDILLSVPAIAVNFKKNIEKSIREKGKLTEQLFTHALRISYRYHRDGWEKKPGWFFIIKPLVRVYDFLIFRRIREGLGGNLRFFIGGGALLDQELQRFFYAIGIPMLQGYGLTEASPIISSNALHKHKLGSSGFLVADLELKICDETGLSLPVGTQGEIVIKGKNVMKGYWKNPDATAVTIRDGWLFTGDRGKMDADGFLYVVGRLKSLLIADDGEKFSPEEMEEAFSGDSEFIDQCMLSNNQKPYTVALIVLNTDRLIRYLNRQGIHPNSEEGISEAFKQIEQIFAAYRPGGIYKDRFPQRWLPVAIAVLEEPFTEENRMINSTMKMVRDKISASYYDRISFLYTPEAKNIQHSLNKNALKKMLGS